MLARHPPARDFPWRARIGDVVDDEDVADESVHLGRDVGVAGIHREAVHADAAGLLIGDALGLCGVRNVIDLEAAVLVTLTRGGFDGGEVRLADAHLSRCLGCGRRATELCSKLRPCRGQLLGAPSNPRHVAFVVDDHHVADDADLVAVRGRIIERDRRDNARMVRVGDVDDRGAELILVGDVTDVGVTARDRHLSGARHVKVREAANLVRSGAPVGRACHSSFAPAAFMMALHFGISALM